MSRAVNRLLQYKTAATRQERVRPHLRKGKPVSGYVRTEEDEDTPLAVQQKKEKELWLIWKQGGKKPEDMRPLLKSFERMLQKKAAMYKGLVRIPPAAIDMEYKRQLLAALDHYDPSKGSLGTYVYKYLDKTKRFIANYQNIARIPENRIYKIREFETAQSYLDEQLGRPPTIDELSKHLSWKPAEIARMSSEIRKDIGTSAFEEDPNKLEPSRAEEVMKLIQYELTPEELQVYRHTFGLSGAPALSPGQISSKLHMSPSKISRIRKKISDKVERYMR